MPLIGMSHKAAFMEALADALPDLDPEIYNDEDTGPYLTARTGPDEWVMVRMSQYGLATVQEASDRTGHMAGGIIAHSLTAHEEATLAIRGRSANRA